MKENFDQASPFTGEYHMGVADFINEVLLNNPKIDWNLHPRWKRVFDSSSTSIMEEEK